MFQMDRKNTDTLIILKKNCPFMFIFAAEKPKFALTDDPYRTA